MWLFTRYGFFSSSCSRGTMFIRTRCKEHLLMLRQRFPKLRKWHIMHTSKADYEYRQIVSRSLWGEILLKMGREQTWDNFKKEAERFQGPLGDAYLDALHHVWWLMYHYLGKEKLEKLLVTDF